MSKKKTIESPCINVCSVDDDTGLCRGCYRTLDEVTHWLKMSDAQRTEVMNTLHQRKATYSERMKPC